MIKQYSIAQINMYQEQILTYQGGQSKSIYMTKQGYTDTGAIHQQNQNSVWTVLDTVYQKMQYQYLE